MNTHGVQKPAPRARAALFLLGMLLAAAGHAAAQPIGVTSTELGVPIILDGGYRLSALTPFTHSLPSGAFTRIRAGGGAFEMRRAHLAWDDQGSPIVQNTSRRNALIGTLLPGTGSLMSGRMMRGLTEIATLGYFAAGSVMAVNDADAAAEDYHGLQERFADEEDLELKRRLKLEIDRAYRRWELRRDHLQGQNLLVGAMAGVAVFESWWFNQSLTARSRAGQLMVDVPRLSRAKAGIASFVFPGLGQAYRGQRRSALYLAAEAYLCQEALDCYTRRRIHDADHQLMTDFLAEDEDGLTTADEAELRRIRDRRQQATEELQFFAGLAGAVWLINMIDIIASHPEDASPAPGGRLGFSTSPGGNPGLAWTRRF